MTEEYQELKSLWVKWGKVGDNIEGTFIDRREMDSTLPGKEGTKTNVYEIKADRGSYHDLDEKKNPVDPAVSVIPGEVYLVGGRMGIDAMMRRVKLGQKVKFLFSEKKKATKKGFNDLKIIKVLAGKMDEEWMAGKDGEVN